MAKSISVPAQSNSATVSASLVASATMGMACPPDDAMSFATASTDGFVRPATITFRPSAANRLHNCAPSPRFGPTPIIAAVFITDLALQDKQPGKYRGAAPAKIMKAPHTSDQMSELTCAFSHLGFCLLQVFSLQCSII